MSRKVIGISMGDPAGVGPELCLRSIADQRVSDCCVPIIFGSATVLERVARACSLELPPETIELEQWPSCSDPGRPCLVDCKVMDCLEPEPGKIQAGCGLAAYAYIRACVESALKGQVDAVTTAPIHKEALHLAGIKYPGHTEMIADLTGAGEVCMMMASDDIAVSLVTTHIGQSRVSGMITSERIEKVISLTVAALIRMGRANPRLVVCGLNPHAGEGGLFGNEEQTVIAPAVESARESGLIIEGPLPPDTAFLPGRLESTDAYVVMYHDQGLIPFKMLAFEKGVNVTLGLPIVRTSPDHGTAFDIAWQGVASPESMIHAIMFAARLAV